MEAYRVHLPKQSFWNDEHDTWIETSYSRGTAFQSRMEEMQDDIYGSIRSGDSVDDIPIAIGGEFEDDEIVID